MTQRYFSLIATMALCATQAAVADVYVYLGSESAAKVFKESENDTLVGTRELNKFALVLEASSSGGGLVVDKAILAFYGKDPADKQKKSVIYSADPSELASRLTVASMANKQIGLVLSSSEQEGSITGDNGQSGESVFTRTELGEFFGKTNTAGTLPKLLKGNFSVLVTKTTEEADSGAAAGETIAKLDASNWTLIQVSRSDKTFEEVIAGFQQQSTQQGFSTEQALRTLIDKP